MAGNSFGQLFRITTFGESHGPALGVIIDGCPPNITLNLQQIQAELNRRKPGQSKLTTQRSEDESFDILSGVFEGKTTGTPICLMVHNKDKRSADYDHLKDVFRPSHADYTYAAKYGVRDHRGGGRASARETVARVLAGAIAKQFLTTQGIHIQAYVHQVGHITLQKNHTQLNLTLTETNPVRCPDPETAAQMEELITQVGKDGDSIGGAIACIATGVPAGLGEPVFDKLHAELGKAMLSINACKGFETGSGFAAAGMRGSEHNDSFSTHEGKITTGTNYSGGIQGGISNGQDIYFRCAFKPVATIRKPQQTVTVTGADTSIEATGRHDPCVVPRAVPIVEAMTALVLADYFLLNRVYHSANHAEKPAS